MQSKAWRKAFASARMAIVAVAVMWSLPVVPMSNAVEVEVVDQRVVVRTTNDASSIVDVRPTGLAYEVYSSRDEITAKQGCVTLEPRLAYCPSMILGIDVEGGAGDDLIGLWDVAVPVIALGGPGNDLLESGSAPDTLEGGQGEDSLAAGDGDDRLAGDDGDDVLSGGGAADAIDGDSGDDVIDGGAGDRDTLFGGDGRDLVSGGPGEDRLNGDDGNDTLVGGAGLDQVDTGAGNDRIFGIDGTRDRLRCDGRDRVRADQGERPQPCGRFAPSEAGTRIPVAWPPQPPTVDPLEAVLSQLPPADPKAKAHLRRPGVARRVSICIEHPYTVKNVPVRVRTFTRRRHVLKRYRVEAEAGTCKSRRRPSPGSRAFHARARLDGDPW